jgi:hypothetical protein
LGIRDATGLPQEPRADDTAAEAFREVPARTILFDDGIHYCLLAEFARGESGRLKSGNAHNSRP